MRSIEIGDSLLAHRFYAGQYREIVTETVDAGEPIDDRDLAFVVGALCFVDRVDEARAMFERASSAPDGNHSLRGSRTDATDPTRREPRTIAACRFFLGLAAARAGYFDRARPLLISEPLRDRHASDPWVRAVVFQGLACYWYFTGRFRGAAEHAMRALQAAHEANFLYVAMLGTDMRGHALVQLGQLHRGIAMLEQTGKQARRLGLTNNAFAVETSIAAYRSQFDPHAEVIEEVEGLLRRKAHDSYSHRVLLIAIAVQHAMRGRRDDALRALEEAERDALRGDTRRGKVASLLARIWVTRFQHGPAACRELIEQARALVEERDVAYRAELVSLDLACALDEDNRGARTPEAALSGADGTTHSPDASEGTSATRSTRSHEAIAELRALWRTSHHFAARAGLLQFDPSHRQLAFDEDLRAQVLRAVAHRDATAIPRLVSLGVVGVIPELLGLVPARRILWLPTSDLLLLEDHGNIVARERPPRWCAPLLQLLSAGATKQRIANALWGIRAYHPDLHDPPVRTTIHRLRAYLGTHASWIVVEDGSYRSLARLHVVRGDRVDSEPIEQTPLWEEGHVPPLEEPREVRAQSTQTLDTKQQLLSRLEISDANVPELAKSLELSASTVLRALRELVDERRVERRGFARATRYHLR